MKPYWVADPRCQGHDVATLIEAYEMALRVTRESGKGVGIYHTHEGMIDWTICRDGEVIKSWEQAPVSTLARIAE